MSSRADRSTSKATSETAGAAKVVKPDRRRVRTRAALISAAQQILADDARGDVTIKEITDTADVGFGSFYNHFETKPELFDAAILDMLDKQGALIEQVTADLDDPAEVYIVGFRLTGRLSRTYPRMARLLVNTGLAYVTGGEGVTPFALQHLRNAITAGRLEADNPELAQAAVGGALLGLVQYLDEFPEVDAGQATDEVAKTVLRMLGMTKRQADALVARPLPDVSAPDDRGPPLLSHTRSRTRR
ncbi:MAG: TetR/AcrR family transcriptional regulator [Actinomycetes bacterium]